ncbi:cobalamin biosynthesis protein [Methanothermococcus okinawensis]|uniref:Cobalamin (Vitamin B12) biosynthesis CbiG protein n=1 Tax=Methanothermococcus okinawensis (strain DSM 14208 / JCM 11175 / IH1) TaxID=647113 RepID=F8AMG6_METOI|nr:cobalamin biosynthesis protein [Methanothermococcus okinawensis]AEH06006.1 cobalamin (vitamin B12) biosynthesis CbiG protein [Methanothermococcus okinawensis IH1]
MIKIVYITKKGEILANNIKHILDYYFYDNRIYHSKDLTIDGNEKGFIFIMATGIVLRKYIDKIKKDKTKDAFVIVLDELGKNIIPILSNHLGGGNYFSKLIGRELKENVVFTTATDVNNKVGIDELSNIYFLDVPKKKDILKINKKVLYEKVDLTLPNGWKPLKNVLNTYNIKYHNNNYVIVDRDIILKPKNIVVGIGARKNIKSYNVYWAVKKALYLRDIPIWRVNAFATVDVKKDEKGILETAKRFKKKLFIFDRKDISEIYKIRDDLIKSDFVFKTIGVYGVSEPVSILGVKKLNDLENIKDISNMDINRDINYINHINLVLKKFKKNGVSISISIG